MANLRIYEILYIIDPTLNEAETDAVHNKVKETMTSAGGSIRREEKWGKRHLAYEVGKFREGFYAYIEFNADGEIVKAMKDMLHLEGRVIRYLITAVPKAKMEEEKRKAREAARRAELAKKKAEAELAAVELAAKEAKPAEAVAGEEPAMDSGDNEEVKTDE